MFDNKITRLIQKHTTGDKLLPWVLVSDAGLATTGLLRWQADTPYSKNALVFGANDDHVYHAQQDLLGSSVWDPTQWTLVDTHVGYVQEYDPTHNYGVDDLVIHDEVLYLSKASTAGVFDPIHWDELTPQITVADAFVYDDDAPKGKRTILQQAIREAVKKALVYTQYDTIIGVGASTINGTFKLNKIWVDGSGDLVPYRGTEFNSQAVPSTTLQFILDNISGTTSLASGKTLFLFFGGLNDCNTYLSPGGMADGTAGDVLGWSALTDEQITTADTLTRAIIAELSTVGDVAIGALHWCDAKGKLLALPDRGATLHTGAWNDNFLIPLCAELTPKFYDTATNRPVFDLYTLVKNNPDILDDDNLHFYNDRDFVPVAAGYPPGNGSHRVRTYLVDRLMDVKAIAATPFDPAVYRNRIWLNLGNETGIVNRPMFLQRGNNLDMFTEPATPKAITKGYYDDRVPVNMTISLVTTGGGISPRVNNSTLWMPFSEGVLEPNLMSSGIFILNTRTMTITITNPGKGKISLAGFWQTTGDIDAITTVTLTDDNGESTGSYLNSMDKDNPPADLSPFMTALDYDATNTGQITLSFTATGTHDYSGLSGIMLDLI